MLIITIINISLINRDNLNSRNTLMNLIILITLNPERFAPSNIKLNKNGVMANKSIMLSGDSINRVKD